MEIQKSDTDEQDLEEAIQKSQKEAWQLEQADLTLAIFESNCEVDKGIVFRLSGWIQRSANAS